MNYNLKNTLKQKLPGTWKSTVKQEAVLMCCRMYYTEFRVTFELKRANENYPNENHSEVEVHVFVYKDLGRGEDAYDPKWIAALREVDSNRDKSDFGRIEKSFQVRELFIVPNDSAEK
jgi:hypothetical protein